VTFRANAVVTQTAAAMWVGQPAASALFLVFVVEFQATGAEWLAAVE